jgi:hypothetical protein
MFENAAKDSANLKAFFGCSEKEFRCRAETRQPDGD